MPVEPLHGTFWRPDLSFDAQRVLFSFHPANEKNFHLYEINIDGSGFRQITQGIYDDVDPIYLPDEEQDAAAEKIPLLSGVIVCSSNQLP